MGVLSHAGVLGNTYGIGLTKTDWGRYFVLLVGSFAVFHYTTVEIRALDL